jgi:membrane protein implicated in regulation of membrane protease activity
LDLTAIPPPYLITIVAILAVLLIAAFKRAAEKRDHERAEQESDHHRADKEILVEKLARAEGKSAAEDVRARYPV